MRIAIMFLCIILPFICFSQKTILGIFFDASNKQPLASASITAKGGRDVVSGNDGAFTL